MGAIVQWAVAALLVAQGTGAATAAMVDDGWSSRQPLAATAVSPLAQSADAPDDEPLDGDVDEPPVQEEPVPVDVETLDEPAAAADEEPLDAGIAPAPVADADLEPLDQGAPPAAGGITSGAPAAAPHPAPVPPAPAPAAPAAAPAPAAPAPAAPAPAPVAKPTEHPAPAYNPAPVSDKKTVSSPKPVSDPAPVWPFDDGGVFVNAGFAPDVAFPFSSGFDTCDNQVRLGRAYVGVGCDGADVTVGHLPAFESASEDGSSLLRFPPSGSGFFSSPVLAVPTSFVAAEPRQTGSESSSPARRAAPTAARTPDAAPTRVVRGESRTTTTTTVSNADGVDEVDVAQGADNVSDARGNRSGNGGGGAINTSRQSASGSDRQPKQGDKAKTEQDSRGEEKSSERQRAENGDYSGDSNKDRTKKDKSKDGNERIDKTEKGGERGSAQRQERDSTGSRRQGDDPKADGKNDRAVDVRQQSEAKRQGAIDSSGKGQRGRKKDGKGAGNVR